MTAEQQAIRRARPTVPAAAMRDKSRAEGPESEADDPLFEEVAERILARGHEALIRYLNDLDACADAEEVPRFDVVRRVNGQTHWVWCFANGQVRYYRIDY